MTCCAIIVNYHTRQFLPGLLKSLKQAPEITDIIIVDNSRQLTGSQPEPLSECRIICNESNWGFGAAVNQGVAAARAEWLLIVNPDVRLEPGCVGHLIQAARQYQSPLTGPRFFLDDEHVFRIPPATGGCFWLDSAEQVAHRHNLDADLYSFYWTLRHDRFWQANMPFVEPFLSGACMLVYHPWLEALQEPLFDERFFMYFEDTDLCARVLAAGQYPICVPDATAVHYYDQAPDLDGSKRKAVAVSRQLFFEKHYGTLPAGLTPPQIATSRPDPESLGALEHPPVFEITKQHSDGYCYFEMGINPWFVPFAQAVVTGQQFVFPSEVWERLASGQYFGRIRYQWGGSGYLWKWQKI